MSKTHWMLRSSAAAASRNMSRVSSVIRNVYDLFFGVFTLLVLAGVRAGGSEAADSDSLRGGSSVSAFCAKAAIRASSSGLVSRRRRFGVGRVLANVDHLLCEYLNFGFGLIVRPLHDSPTDWHDVHVGTALVDGRLE